VKLGVLVISLMSLGVLIPNCDAQSHEAKHGNERVIQIPLCRLLADPRAYAGKTVEVVARITATKEGIDIWDPTCKNIGVDLVIDFDAPGKKGFSELEDSLRAHGLSDHPVIATLRGMFIPNQYDKVRRKKRTVLAVESVEGVHQAASVERR